MERKVLVLTLFPTTYIIYIDGDVIWFEIDWKIIDQCMCAIRMLFKKERKEKREKRKCYIKNSMNFLLYRSIFIAAALKALSLSFKKNTEYNSSNQICIENSFYR